MHKEYRKILMWLAVIVVMCLSITAGIFAYGQYVGFGAPAHPNFIGYKPTLLPDNTTVTGQSLTRVHQVGVDFWIFTYQVRLSTNDFTINEEQKDPNEPRVVNCQGYGDVCAIHSTPQGQTYRVWYGRYKGKPFGLQVEWIEHNTHITLAVSNSSAEKYLHYDWGVVVDSMRPVDLSYMPYARQNVSGSGG